MLTAGSFSVESESGSGSANSSAPAAGSSTGRVKSSALTAVSSAESANLSSGASSVFEEVSAAEERSTVFPPSSCTLFKIESISKSLSGAPKSSSFFLSPAGFAVSSISIMTLSSSSSVSTEAAALCVSFSVPSESSVSTFIT